MTNERKDLIVRLALQFIEELKKDLSTVGATLEDVAIRNEAGGHTATDAVCCSHDFIDANESMLTAWEKIGLDPVDPSSAEDAALWGEAWQKAKACGFLYHRDSQPKRSN